MSNSRKVFSCHRGKVKLTNFLVIYLKFVFFAVFVSPYRLVEQVHKDKGGLKCPRFALKSFWPQRFLCIIFDIPCLFWLLREIRLSLPTDGRNPSMHFRLILSFLSAIVKYSVMLKLWSFPERFLDIVNFIADSDIAENQPKTGSSHVDNIVLRRKCRILNVIQRKATIIFICMMYTFMTTFNVHIGRGLQGLHRQDQSSSFYNWNS